MIDAAEAEKLASEILPRSVANRARPMSDAAEAQKLDAATEREKQLVAAAVLAPGLGALLRDVHVAPARGRAGGAAARA